MNGNAKKIDEVSQCSSTDHAMNKEYRNREIIFIVEESPGGGYEARSLGHSIFPEADSFEELKNMVQDAVSCHFDEEGRPRIIRLHIVKEELIAI